mmetsp:Transcript_38524/g.86840  ORF Transcript_38524/g.86840 Transcript_38524/m.86840 type:complete len:102 (-) Transcript_38524:184-489(-)
MGEDNNDAAGNEKEESKVPAIRHQKSILSGCSGRDRKDSFGTPISRGSKTHRCSFRDEKSDNPQPVQDVKEVAAYKTACLASDCRDDDKQGCSCTLMCTLM